MIKKIICLGLLSSMSVYAETGQQRLERLKQQESPSIMQRIKASGLDKDLTVLDDYYQQLTEKMHSDESVGNKPKVLNKTPMQKDKQIKAKRVPDIDQTIPIIDSAHVDDLFLQAKQKSTLTATDSFKTSEKFRGRDPFAITEEMVRGDASLQASLDFLPDDKSKFTVPAMTIKGLVMREDGLYVAVLDIEGYGTKVVRKGDTIGLQGSGDAAIRIKEITRLQIIVEAGKVGKVIVVR